MQWSHAALQLPKKSFHPNTVRWDKHSVASTIDLEIVNAQVLVLVPEWSAKANRDHEEPQPTHEAVDANVPVGITPIQPVLEDAVTVGIGLRWRERVLPCRNGKTRRDIGLQIMRKRSP